MPLHWSKIDVANLNNDVQIKNTITLFHAFS